MNKLCKLALDQLISNLLDNPPPLRQRNFYFPTIFLANGQSNSRCHMTHGDRCVLDDANVLYGYRGLLVWQQGPTYRVLIAKRWEVIRGQTCALQEALAA